ncbi:hypothetical protein BD560DRAFT_332482 [Blakeslea trispora]|nr:hypothetical protein BD560DRAFT_332482 [Blakeslea trispora]
MYSSIVLILFASAATVFGSTTGCNPSYNVTSSGTCFSNCNSQAGSAYLSGWTMDPDSPLFIKSLSIMCNKGTPEYLAFMTKAGMCMVNCPDDPTLFNTEFSGACSWYNQHKNDTCVSSDALSTSASNSSSSVMKESSSAGTNHASYDTILFLALAVTGLIAF